jgi:hypothetical protein
MHDASGYILAKPNHVVGYVRIGSKMEVDIGSEDVIVQKAFSLIVVTRSVLELINGLNSV